MIDDIESFLPENRATKLSVEEFFLTNSSLADLCSQQQRASRLAVYRQTAGEYKQEER
ncbi:MAG TPA: hypothetical protein VHE60_12955 [Pyrinomonadaceae bacterium]|nr:hypothetical protein [Pyrinomonadaceae bacterium]